MIVSHFDFEYLGFAEIFLYSINKNSPEEKIFLSTMNLSKEQISQLQEKYKIEKIQNHTLDIKSCNKKHLLQNRVTKVILEAIYSDLDSIYIVMNIDMIVRKSLFYLREKMKNYDIGLCINSSHPKRCPPQLLNGFLIFNTKEKVVKFVEQYDRIVHAAGNFFFCDQDLVILSDTFHKDQEALFSMYSRYKKDLSFLYLDYSDFFTEFSSKGFVWSAGRKDKDSVLRRFREEIY